MFILEIAQKVHNIFFCNSPHVWIIIRAMICENMVWNLFVGGVVLAKNDAFFTHSLKNNDSSRHMKREDAFKKKKPHENRPTSLGCAATCLTIVFSTSVILFIIIY